MPGCAHADGRSAAAAARTQPGASRSPAGAAAAAIADACATTAGAATRPAGAGADKANLENEAEFGSVKADAKVEYEKQMSELNSQVDAAKQKLRELDQRGEDAWGKVRKSASDAVDRFK